MMQVIRSLIVAIFTIAGLKASAVDVVLDWNSSSSTDASGYYVYYGTTSGIYSYRVDAGSATSVTLTNLIPGATYYLAATTYDSTGNQSAFSGELSYVVPASSINGSTPTLTMTASPNAGNPASLQFPAQTGHWYEIQATSDLVNWTSIWQSAVATADTSLQFTDPDSASYSSRFYRLVAH